jgi:Na+/melibiose symporter-like transporter
MTHLKRRREIFSSPPVLFLLYAITFGVITQYIGNKNLHQSLIPSAVSAVIFGVLMTFSTMKRLRRFNQSTGLSDPKDQQELHDAVRKGIMPTEPALKEAMPSYLKKRMENLNSRTKRNLL